MKNYDSLRQSLQIKDRTIKKLTDLNPNISARKIQEKSETTRSERVLL